jgi:hypothetical protein
MRGVTPIYPDDCIQNLCGDWWEETGERRLEYGRLVRAFLPHVDQQPYLLVAHGRTDPEAHQEAEFEIQPLLANKPPTEAYLPVAGLPAYSGEVRILQRAKKRPALILSTSGAAVERRLKAGSARYLTNRSVLVAPYYGADRSGKRGGFKPEFVQRIRRAEYPQYSWDSLPISGASESILRFDHLQPLGENAQAVEITPYRLTVDAADIIEEWLSWFRTGGLTENGVLAYFRKEMSAE